MLKRFQQIEDISYFPCLEEGHEGQDLCTVCIDPFCDSNNLLCIFCEE